VNWVLDADIRGFFDTIDHGWLLQFLEHRIGDRRILRLIQKWLRSGVMDKGKWAKSLEGTPQGATVSPLLGNLYLHYVFDLFVQQWRVRYARGDVTVTRYADDFVVGFQHREDAERFLRELRARLQKFSLELHPDKTRVIEFGRYAASNRRARGEGKPETFHFLGFLHLCGKTETGKFLIARRTQPERMRTKLREVKAELRRRRHQPVPSQGKWLRSVVNGHFAYYAVPTNGQSLGRFRKEVTRQWHRALRRRSQRDRTNWQRMRRLADRWIPTVRIRHAWPDERFDVRTRGRSPVH
jgi:group II intron reverse transcriptase/maturase